MKSVKIALLAIGVFVGLAGASFFGSKYLPEPKVPAPQVQSLQPVKLDIPSESDQQVIIGQMLNGATIVLDAASIKIDGDKRTFTIEIVEPEGTVSEEGDHILGVIMKNSVDCKAHTSQVLSSVLLSEEGKVISAKTTPGPIVKIPPDSRGTQVEKMLCTVPDGTPYKAPAKKLPPGTESV